jgi:hypothetical protein
LKGEIMADDPTVANSKGSGATAVTIIVAIAAVVSLLFLFGVFEFSNGSGRIIKVNVDAPAIDTPAAPDALAVPANGG